MADEQHMLERHNNIWQGFCRLLTWSMIGVIVTLVLMWVFLV